MVRYLMILCIQDILGVGTVAFGRGEEKLASEEADLARHAERCSR